METSIPQETFEEKTESLNIEQNNKKYLLIMKLKGNELTLVLSDPEEIVSYAKKMKLNEIKEIHKYFSGIDSCEQFFKFLKGSVGNKQLIIIKKEESLCLKCTFDYMFEKNSIELILSPKEKKPEEITKELYNEISTLKEKIKIIEKKEGVENENLKNENKKLTDIIKELRADNEKLKEEIKEMKALIEPMNKRFKEININKYTSYNEKSVIMKEDELNFISQAMKFKMNKEIKEIRKLYQATVHGDSANSFHSKCDGIPNTLVIIKSSGNRRFGGFTTVKWSSDNNGSYDFDKNSFLFSLDRQKIYPYCGQEQWQNYTNNKYAVYSYKECGPTFGGCEIYGSGYNHIYDVYICSNCMQGVKSSYTNETNQNSSYDFYKDVNALSEDGKKGCIYIKEYEVFQVIFKEN